MLSILFAVLLAAITLVLGTLATYGVLKRFSLPQRAKAAVFVLIGVLFLTPVWMPVDITLTLFFPSLGQE